MTCPSSHPVAADARIQSPRSVSPWADRPSTPAESIAPQPRNGPTTAALISRRADRLQHANGIQKRRYIETQMALATYSEARHEAD